MYTAANRSDFQRDIWNIDDLEAGLEANGLSLETLQFLSVKHWTTIRAIIGIFSRQCNGSSTVATFLLWHSAMRDVVALESATGKAPQCLFEVCKQQVSSVWQLGRNLKKVIVSCVAKGVQLRVVLDNVKDTVHADLLKSRLVTPDDQNRLEQ
ncbi:hypothetical protein MRX96_007844 [Rhipicephalus microplus]